MILAYPSLCFRLCKYILAVSVTISGSITVTVSVTLLHVSVTVSVAVSHGDRTHGVCLNHACTYARIIRCWCWCNSTCIVLCDIGSLYVLSVSVTVSLPVTGSVTASVTASVTVSVAVSAMLAERTNCAVGWCWCNTAVDTQPRLAAS